MKKHEILVRYISSYKEPDEDGIILENYKSVKIDKGYSKLYSSGIAKLIRLKGVELSLFMFLCQISDNDGLVRSEKHYYSEFRKWLTIDNNERFPYTTDTVRKAYTELAKTGLLIKLKRGIYRINPVHYWKGSVDHERIDAVRSLLEKKVIEPWYVHDSKKKTLKSPRSIFDLKDINFDEVDE